MPVEGITKATKSKGVRMIRRHRSHTEGTHTDRPSMSRYRDDVETDGMPSALRDRLYDLFGQIEKEFDTLYTANITLQERVDALNEKIEVSSTSDKQLIDSQDTPDLGSKPKRSASQISQKIKTTYKVSTSKIVSSFRAPTSSFTYVRDYRGHRDGVWEVKLSKSDPHVIGTASADHTARLFSIETGICLLRYTGHQGSVNSIRFHPNKDLVLTGSGDERAHIWSSQVTLPSHGEVVKSHSSGEDDLDGSEKEEMMEDQDQVTDCVTQRSPLMELSGHVGVIIAADWMAGGTQAVTASWDRTAILHDTESGEIINTLTGHDQELTEVEAHPSQRMAVTCSKDTTFRLWDFRAPAMLVNVFQGHTQPVTTAVFASNDRVISGSDDRRAKIWDLRNMRSPIATIQCDSAINRLAVCDATQIIAIPQDNRHVKLCDINGNRIGRLPRSSRQGHTRMVTSVSWAADTSTNLFTCGFDRQVLGWQVWIQPKDKE
ncbi:WD repeat-containing protein 37 isoform X1 [Patella vulgata]|uniref:WD repeat-containing protein 37 isoform X1 n=1 Tax=Patella vulgata TaxID=6465 RepID=UPI00217FF35B|nr:WD repeat-containing protein 37 isoform X1 [Patella vulgata]